MNMIDYAETSNLTHIKLIVKDLNDLMTCIDLRTI